MARKKKEDIDDGLPKEKKSDIYTLIGYLTFDKKPWNNLTVEEQKLFTPFMVNRFLSMDVYLCEAINELQRYTVNVMEKEDVWKLYYYLLPKQRYFLKYIKSKNENNKDIDLLIKYYGLSRRECEEYYELLLNTSAGRKELDFVKENYSYENRK